MAIVSATAMNKDDLEEVVEFEERIMPNLHGLTSG